jgi:hypothetical protein
MAACAVWGSAGSATDGSGGLLLGQVPAGSIFCTSLGLRLAAAALRGGPSSATPTLLRCLEHQARSPALPVGGSLGASAELWGSAVAQLAELARGDAATCGRVLQTFLHLQAKVDQVGSSWPAGVKLLAAAAAYGLVRCCRTRFAG